MQWPPPFAVVHGFNELAYFLINVQSRLPSITITGCRRQADYDDEGKNLKDETLYQPRFFPAISSTFQDEK